MNTIIGTKYSDLAGVLKRLWNVKVTVIPVVVGQLGTISKGLERILLELEICERIETYDITLMIS